MSDIEKLYKELQKLLLKQANIKIDLVLTSQKITKIRKTIRHLETKKTNVKQKITYNRPSKRKNMLIKDLDPSNLEN